MKLTMLQDTLNSKNKLQAAKGEKVELISDSHFPVLLCRNDRGNSFSVKSEGTNYEELKNKPCDTL